MVDQRRQIIDEIHKLNILLIHTKLKTTRAQTVARATTHVRNVDAARRGTVPRPKPSKPIEADVHMLDCLNDEELSTLGELLSVSSTTPIPNFWMRRFPNAARRSTNSSC